VTRRIGLTYIHARIYALLVRDNEGLGLAVVRDVARVRMMLAAEFAGRDRPVDDELLAERALLGVSDGPGRAAAR
jgi:hypothetical protein